MHNPRNFQDSDSIKEILIVPIIVNHQKTMARKNYINIQRNTQTSRSSRSPLHCHVPFSVFKLSNCWRSCLFSSSLGGSFFFYKTFITRTQYAHSTSHIEVIRPIAELQIKPKSKSNQTKNLEMLYNCLVSFFLSFFLSCRRRCCHAQNSSDVTLAFEDAD